MASDPTTDAPALTVVIACYDEEPHLEESVAELMATLDATIWSYELIFVDDCSNDGTRAVIERIVAKHGERVLMRVLLHEENTGRGRAVSDGMRLGRGSVIGFLDIDLEVHARYVPAMVRAIEEGADVAIAQRVYRIAPSPSFIVRHVLSRGYRYLVESLLELGDIDTEAGYKFFDRGALPGLLDACRDPGWFWDTEVMALARARGLKIAQIPCLFLRRGDKRSTLRVIPATIDYLQKIVALRRRLRSGGGAQ